MLIPTQVAKNVGKVAARENTRYAINGVHLERKGDDCIAVATDGRSLLKVRWSDVDRTEYPPMEGVSHEPKAGFSTLLPVKELAESAKMPPRRPVRQILGRIVLDEQSANGTVTFGSTDMVNIQTRRVVPVEGHFPRYDDVIARYRVGYDAVEIGVSPYLLSRLLTAMEGAALSDDNRGIRMTVPIDPAKPIVLDSQDRKEGVEATGVLMPVGLLERRITGTPIQHVERLADELGRMVHMFKAMEKQLSKDPTTPASDLLVTDEAVRTVTSAQHTLEMAGCWVEPPVDEPEEATEPQTAIEKSDMAQAA